MDWSCHCCCCRPSSCCCLLQRGVTGGEPNPPTMTPISSFKGAQCQLHSTTESSILELYRSSCCLFQRPREFRGRVLVLPKNGQTTSTFALPVTPVTAHGIVVCGCCHAREPQREPQRPSTTQRIVSQRKTQPNSPWYVETVGLMLFGCLMESVGGGNDQQRRRGRWKESTHQEGTNDWVVSMEGGAF